MKKHKDTTPTHHLIVETADWSNILLARKKGVAWDELRTRSGLSALGMAIFEGSALATQNLLEMGAPVLSEKLYDGQFFSPLWASLERRKPAILDLVLQAGCDPNEQHPDYGLPLMFAANQTLLDETLILCKHGATPNTPNAPTPLWLWIKHTIPYYDSNEQQWIFPEKNPIAALLKNGARVAEDEGNDAGMGEIELAKKLWLKHPLKGVHHQNALLMLSLMERNLYANVTSESNLNANKDPEERHKSSAKREHRM